MTPDALEVRARALLSKLPDGEALTSSQLLFRLGHDVTKRDQTTNVLYRTLRDLAETSMADCSSRGRPYVQYGKTIRPYLWHAPVDQEEEPELNPEALEFRINSIERKIDEIGLLLGRVSNTIHRCLVPGRSCPDGCCEEAEGK